MICSKWRARCLSSWTPRSLRDERFVVWCLTLEFCLVLNFSISIYASFVVNCVKNQRCILLGCFILFLWGNCLFSLEEFISVCWLRFSCKCKELEVRYHISNDFNLIIGRKSFEVVQDLQTSICYLLQVWDLRFGLFL